MSTRNNAYVYVYTQLCTSMNRFVIGPLCVTIIFASVKENHITSYVKLMSSTAIIQISYKYTGCFFSSIEHLVL